MALGHRRLCDQEGAGDLLSGQAAQRPQNEGDLRLGGEGRMTAGEDELESLVWESRRVHLVLRGLGHLEQAGLRVSVRLRRIRSMARLRAVVTSHAQGFAGVPSRGQRSAAIANASCAASSARSKSPRKPIRAART